MASDDMIHSYSSQMRGTLLVTGATGFIGSRLAALALSRGYSVRTLTRSDWVTPPAVPVDQRYFGSLPEPIPIEALHGVDVVVHCAAHVGGGERAAFAVNVEGTIRLAHLAQQAGVKSFIFLSSQSARPDAISSYGRTKYMAERRLLDDEGDLHVIILRPGLVVGQGDKGLFGRLSRVVESLPVLPLLGGGRSIVQPIHIDDLCSAVFLCVQKAAGLKKTILHLGYPEGIELAELLQHIAVARLGRRRFTLPIPFWPVEILVGVAEGLRIPFPIHSNNVKALKIIERMDTGPDLSRLDLNLRPLAEIVQDDSTAVVPALSLKERAVRVLLVGAGRIGIVHAVTLSRLRGAVLCGIVDPKPRATGIIRGMGVPVPMFRTLEEALSQVKPDAAVIATPGSTHLGLTRACLDRGLAVLVEKPLAIQREQLPEYEHLAHRFPTLPVQVGYVMPRNPQIASCLERLRAGRFGKVRGFLGITLVSLIQERGGTRWELRKHISGGGAFINAGGHVLSMIRNAFGEPDAVQAQSVKLYSTEVEDSVVVAFTYPEFRGTHYCSWSINGYPRQENMLTVWTDQGRLVLTGSVGVFVRNDGEVDITHQLDFDVGFNMAPDYAGAGFTAELIDLVEATRTGRSAAMSVTEGIRLERLLFKIYDVAAEVRTFTRDTGVGESPRATKPRLAEAADHTEKALPAVRRVLDLRDLSAARARAYLMGIVDGSTWDEYLLAPAQVKRLPKQWRAGKRLRVTVPDFLNQSRLVSNGRHVEVLKQLGLAGIVAGVRAATSVLSSERAVTFWVAAMGLLGAALRLVPVQFQGTLLLHAYLTDLALALRRTDMLDTMLARCRTLRPRARVGFHTNMASEALTALRLLETPVDEVSVLTSPRARDMARMLDSMRQAGLPRARTLTAEVGLAPSVVHRVAFEAPHHWSFGADAVLIGVAADSALAGQWRADVEQNWMAVFPGLTLPDGAW